MKVIIYEYLSGGGYAGQAIPLSILAEGYAILRCVVADFKAAGHEVTVLLDGRISKLNPPLKADCVVPVFYANEPQRFLASIAKINDATYIIAPETDQILQSLVKVTEETGKISLNCESQAIAKVADKAILFETLQELGVTPKTLVLNVDSDIFEIKKTVKNKLGYPVVLKPADGTSCSGVSIVRDEFQVDAAIAKIKAESKAKRFIAQEFINGQAASVSLLCTSTKAQSISLNRQDVTISTPDATSSYEGGAVPFDYWLKQKAFSMAEKVATVFSGLRGYVGVDLVLTEHQAFVVDVNPRLTTSYVGLHEVARCNFSEMMVEAVLENKLPSKFEFNGVARFSKIETPKPTLAALREVAELRSVVSPPFPLYDDSEAVSLVVGEGANLEDATHRLEEAKKRLRNIIG